MEPTQDVASPQDQPTTDPLAIEQPSQPEPPPSSAPEPEAEPSGQTVEPPSSTDHVIPAPAQPPPSQEQAVDPLADANPVEPCESSTVAVEPVKESPSSSTTTPVEQQPQDGGSSSVSSSDGPAEVVSETPEAKPTTTMTTAVDTAPTSSFSVKNAVTGDNSLKINGISDLSILDVTQGNDDDEIEVKVEGGSLMHKVIKFSLLNGMQDSSKRLENSRLIMSGVSSTATNANGGEATLATTSSLSSRVGSLGGGPLRQDDKAKEEGFKGGGSADSKTTPPACSSSGLRPESVEPGSSFSNSSNSNSNSGSEESKPNRTEDQRLRNSVDSNHSAESVPPAPAPSREESASDTYGRSASLDFRESPVVAPAAPSSSVPRPPTPPPQPPTVTATKETDQLADPPQEAKRPPKAMYYAELPDFSKPLFSAPPTSATSTTTSSFPATKSLSQLQMKTPDFSRIVQASAGPQPSSSSSISPAPTPSSTAHRSHELQIANPDFSKSFGPKPTSSSSPSPSARPEERSPYMHPSSFAELSKQRNYISDLQLKNPPHGSSDPAKAAGPPPPASLSNFRIEKPQVPKPYPSSVYRPAEAAGSGPAPQLEEPKAHVIHKASTSSSSESKPWNPAVGPYGPGRYPPPQHQYQKGPPPPLQSEQSHPQPPPHGGYPSYPPYPTGKSKEPHPPTAAHPGGIIVNNVKTYYPESQQQQQQQPLPKSKEPEFRLDHKEKQLRQEGTIITLKPNEGRPAPSSAQPPHYPPYPRSRSPSAERREAQMMASSQEILYRDFKLKQSYEMPRSPATGRPEEPRAIPRDRSPYDPYYRGGAPAPPAKYYPPEHHHKPSSAGSPASSATPSPTPMHSRNRSPVSHPQKPQPAGPSGLMHPPSSWPSQGRVTPQSMPSAASPNHYLPPKGSPSPVQYGGPPAPHSYKSPSPSSSSSPSPYAGAPPAPSGSVTKYTQYYPSGNGERVVSIEVDKEQYKPGYKGLDYNMEQKFAEVYQAHQMKEKQATSKQPQQYSVPPHPSAHHPAYKAAQQPPPPQQHPDRDEYGRSRVQGPPVVVNQQRYPPSQENLTHYGHQYQYPPRHPQEAEVRPYPKPSSRDPSPGRAPYHSSSKQPPYPYSKPPQQHPAATPSYPPNAEPPSQYPGVMPGGKSSYSPYDRTAEKPQPQQHHHPSVISNTYEQRAGASSRVPGVYPESQRPPEHYPPQHGSQYHQSMPAARAVPPPSRDPNWQHYQQAPAAPPQPQQQSAQPGPSGYGPERGPMVRDERQNPVIHPPINKNIPVKVIATANSVPAVPSSTTIAPATSTTKRESPLDLSVKTVKTKADSTASDDYHGHGSRSREVAPKVNFNPNFKKHEQPEHHHHRQPMQPQQPVPGPSQSSYHVPTPREPQPIPPPHPHHSSRGAVSAESRQMPVINPAIPPGYDKKTDAYMSANYRAVGGPGDPRYPPADSRYGPQPQPGRPEHYGIPPSPYPPGPPGSYPQQQQQQPQRLPQHPYQLPPKSEPYYSSGAKQQAPPGPSVSSRSVYYPPHEAARGSKQQVPPAPKSHMDDPRIEDRKFVESMLKKQASPSAEVIADLQAGKFSTRLPTTLAPAKKRPAETIPKTSPTKVSRIEEPALHRPYENSYRHPQYPGPAAPRDYYPVPIKHEPASPQPAGVYYGDKRAEMPSITRGVLNTAQTHPSVLQPNVQQATRPPIDTHPSVITSYHAASSRPKEEGPPQRYLDDRGQPFRHGDPKYYGSGPAVVEKPSHPADRSETVVMQSHIQYGGHLPPHQQQQQQQQQQPPMHYKRPEVVVQQMPPRPDYGSPPNHAPRPTSIVENHQTTGRSYENIPRLISDPPKVSPDQRPTPPYHHSSQESLSQASSLPSPQHRGADQSVISKLRNSLELKERNNQLRKQTSSEMSEEDSKPLDLNSFPPSHFRSKGAMKAYTPIPAFDTPQQEQQQPPAPVPEPAPKPASPVKQEPLEIPKEPIEPPADIEGASALDILDWGSACNEFVEQLQTGKKRGRRKRGIGAKRDGEAAALHDGFRNDLPGMTNSALSEVPQEVLKSAAQEIGDFASSSDEDKPLHLLKQQQQEDEQLLAIRNSTMEKLTEKIARNMREKQRLEQEQRHEAKLGRSSSSESESDNRRVVQRAKMRARKLRNRLSVPLKCSDVNTDGEDEEEEEEDQARDLRKRKKMDQTSSDSEPAEAQSKKLNRCQTQEIKQENGTDLSSDEEDPKAPSPNKKDKRLEVKSETVKQGAQSDSESNDVKTNESSVKEEAKNCEAEVRTSGSESEKSEKPKKRGPKKFAKPRTTSRSKVVEESSESEESSDEAETMTRSKSKLVLEKQKSNSKVLRNDKIVGNFVKDRKRHDSLTPQKGRKAVVNVKLEASKKRILDSDSDGKSAKKRTRKTSKLQTTSASDSSEESDVATGHRLRTRKQKASESSAPSSATKRCNSQEGKTPSKGADKKNIKSEPPKKRGRQPKKTSKDCATENTSENFYPGWEKELYEFKRSLKVPPQLITIGGRQYVHRISTSLPDLDSPHHSDESETFSEIVKKINQKDSAPAGKKVKTKAAAKHGGKSSKEQQVEEKKIDANIKFSSIIELLHERMLRQVKLGKGKKSKSGNDKDAPKVKSEFELLPTPGAESEALFNRKKKSLFDTAIFKSRTRTEQKVMQSKEIIREVFGGDDERPQSAPPLGCGKELKNVTYDEMYNEMLTKTDHVVTFLAQKKLQKDKAVASTSGQSSSTVRVKIEDLDDETQDSVLKDSGRVTEEGDTPSVVSERDLATPVSFRGKKKTHKSRRKGSSGFDYIRKKKKPTVNNGEHSTPVVPRKKVISAFENLQSKDETHINKEIRSWVLNKGVGESVMHKAARLGYTDVIVYCLERLEMDPDLKDNAGYTPLHEACAKGHLDICNYLLQYGASHSETALSGIRPLHEAVENSFIEVVRLLLAFGADPMLATYAGQTPIQLAENNEMALFLENHLIDIQSMSPTKTGWKIDGPWKAHDPEESGCDLFAELPDFPDEDTSAHNNSGTTERSSLSSSTTTTTTQSSSSDQPTCLPPPPPPPPQQPAPKRCDSNSNIMNFEIKSESELLYERKYKDCAVVLNDIHDGRTAVGSGTAYLNGQLREIKRECPEEIVNGGGGGEASDDDEDGNGGEFMFEYEEADRPLPPLYLLKDEAAGEKWVLMTDLCNFLKLKSKEAVMKQICPNPTTTNNSTNPNNTNNGATAAPGGTTSATTAASSGRELIRELKLEDFLTRASCLQLLCAGEKLNIHSSKVVLVKYNDNVRNLLQVQTLVTKI